MEEEKINSGGELMYNDLFLPFGGGINNKAVLAEHSDNPILFIGLGGFGVECVREIKKEVYTRIKPDSVLNGFPKYERLQFLAIDTDPYSMRGDEMIFDLDDDECIDISIHDIKAVLNNIELLKNNSAFDWLVENYNICDASCGSGGVRQIGRLGLIKNIDTILRVIVSKIRRLQNVSQNENLKICLFSGLGGGTGSGIILDLCYIIRQILIDHNLVHRAIIKGFFYLGYGNICQEQVRKHNMVNVYAFLKELDYCMHFDSNGGEWSQEYGAVRVKTRRGPVDVAFLIDDNDESRTIVERNQVVNEIVDYVLYDSVIKKENPPMLPVQAVESPYYAIGCRCLRVPYKEILTYLTAIVFKEYDDVLKNKSDGTEQFVQLNSLLYEDIFNELNNDISEVPMYDVDPRELYTQLCEFGPVPPILHPMRDSVQKIESELNINISVVVSKVMKQVKTKLIGISMDENNGPAVLKTLLRNDTGKDRSLIEVIHGYLTDTDVRIVNQHAIIEQEALNLVNIFHSILQGSRFTKRRRLLDFPAFVNSYYHKLARLTSYEKMKSLLFELKNHLVQFEIDYCSPLNLIMGKLRDAFWDNQSYIENVSFFQNENYLLSPDEMDTFCKSYFENRDKREILFGFIRCLINSGEKLSIMSQREVCLFTEAYFNEVFSDVTHMTLIELFSQTQGENAGIAVINHMFAESLMRLYQDTSLLFSMDQFHQENLVRETIIGYPVNEIVMFNAVQQFQNNNIVVIPESIFGHDSVVIRQYASVSFNDISRIASYKESYQSVNWSGLHLYEGNETDKRDF